VAGGQGDYCTHGWQRESGVCDDSERTVKLLIEAHEPQSVEGLYIRERPAIKATRDRESQQQRPRGTI
jgi:hypothetical protein